MRLLGIDYGHKKVGLALSDASGRFAAPYKVIENDRMLVPRIHTACLKEGVGKIVVGESLDLKGQPNEIMADINIFVEKIKQATGLPVELEPEFYTSREASHVAGQDKDLDARAAALILKSHIDKRDSN